MGSSGGGGTTTTSGGASTTERQPTAAESQLTELELGRQTFLDPQLRTTQAAGLNLAENLLTGGTAPGGGLPGFLSGLPGGLTPEIIDEIAAESVRQVEPKFQQSGLFDSGVRASSLARVQGDVRRSAAEFNIGNLQNLLNLALSGQAQVQQPILGFSAQLGNRLQSLGPVTSSQQFTQSRSPIGGGGGGLFGFF